jgi:hypothetical protein
MFPYKALAKHGIYPGTPAGVVHEFFPSERDESEAWQVLRDIRSRLKIDFFLYQTSDEERLTQFQERLHTMTAAPHSSVVQAKLEDDAPMIFLLAGERKKAKEMLENQQLKNPADLRSTHRLALLNYAEAKHFAVNRDYTPALTAWQETIAHWVRALADHEYWDTWCNERRRCYQEPSRQSLRIGFNAGAHKDLQEYLRTELNKLVVSIEHEESKELVQAYHDLLAFYEAERAGADALKDAGGLELDRGYAVFCGPYMIEKLDLSSRLHKMIDHLQELVRRYDELPATTALERSEPPVSSPILNRLRLYFSNLRHVAAQLSLNKPEQALEILAASGALDGAPVTDELYRAIKGGATLYRKDIAELAIQAHVALALQYLTLIPANLTAAEAAWRDVMKRAIESHHRRIAAEAISKQAIGRVIALETDIERDEMQRLNETIEILNRASSVLRGMRNDELAAVLVEKLAERGKYNFIQDRVEESVADLRIAFDMAPHDAFVREQYAFYLLTHAKDKAKSYSPDEALTIMEQAKRLVEQGLLEHPDDENLKETRDAIQTEMNFLLHGGSSDFAWDELDQALEQLQQPVDDQVLRERVAEAENKRGNLDYLGAANIIEDVLKQKPDYAWAKAEAAEIYVAWAAELLGGGDFDDAEQKVRLAAQQGIQSMRLSTLLEEIARARDFMER